MRTRFLYSRHSGVLDTGSNALSQETKAGSIIYQSKLRDIENIEAEIEENRQGKKKVLGDGIVSATVVLDKRIDDLKQQKATALIALNSIEVRPETGLNSVVGLVTAMTGLSIQSSRQMTQVLISVLVDILSIFCLVALVDKKLFKVVLEGGETSPDKYQQDYQISEKMKVTGNVSSPLDHTIESQVKYDEARIPQGLDPLSRPVSRPVSAPVLENEVVSRPVLKSDNEVVSRPVTKKQDRSQKDVKFEKNVQRLMDGALGEKPSINQVAKLCHVGKIKAKEIIAEAAKRQSKENEKVVPIK